MLRLLGCAGIAVLCFICGGILGSHREAASPFALADQLEDTYTRELQQRFEALYGAEAIDVAVCISVDTAITEYQRDEIDPSTALAVERAASDSQPGSHTTRYEASRWREQRRETLPRIRLSRVVLRADPALALPPGSEPRQPTESEREQLTEELSSLVRGVVPAGRDAEDADCAVDVILRTTAKAVNVARAESSSFSITSKLFGLGVLLLSAMALLTLVTKRRQRQLTRQSTQQPPPTAPPLEVLNAKSTAAPHEMARILEVWSQVEVPSPSSHPHRSSQAAAYLLSRLDSTIATAIRSHMDPTALQRIAIALASAPVRSPWIAESALCNFALEDLRRSVEKQALEGASFLELCRAQMTPEMLAETSTQIERCVERRRHQERLAGLQPNELDRVIASMKPEAVRTLLAQLDPDQVSIWLQQLDQTARHTWLDRLRTPPAQSPETIDALLAHAATLAADLHRLALQATEIDRSRAHLLARWPCELRQAALEHVAAQDLAAAQRIREHLIGFPDLPRLDEEEIRSLLGCLELGDLALALKDAPQEIEDAIERALTPRVRQRLSEERAQCRDAAPEQTEQAREHLVEMLRDLFERGSIDLHDDALAIGSKR